MISHLNQYIIDGMTRSYKIVCIFLLCTVRYLFFGTKVISRLIGLIYENIAKMANKIFNVPNHLNCSRDFLPLLQSYLRDQIALISNKQTILKKK